MSCFVIKMESGRKIGYPITSREQYMKLRESGEQTACLTKARSGNSRAKLRLMQFNYSLAGTEPFALKGYDIVGKTVGMDVDFDPKAKDYEKRLKEAPQLILDKKEELGLMLLERSVNKGFHLVFRRRAGLSQEENLRWASDLLQIPFDQAAKDVTRVFFATGATKKDLIFLDDTLFDNAPFEAENAPVAELRLAENNGNPTEETSSQEATESQPATYPIMYQGMPYTSIVEALENQLGGRPEHGSRNAFIFSMACNLRYLCNDDPQWIASLLPDYGEEQGRWMSTIRSACERKQTLAMPEIVKRALKVAQQENRCDGDGEGEDAPPQMPKRLPKLIELLTSQTPEIYRAAVAHAVFPPLATHLWRTRFPYIDNVEHEATLMCVLMAGTGAGKSCVSEPIKHIMADIRERDQENLEREKAWKEEVGRKGANKDKAKRPENLVIQEIDADMTNPAFVMRTAEAKEHFLYTSLNEIDQFDALRGIGNQQFRIMCLAFDPSNKFGQSRVGIQSVTERVCVRFNWNASTTIDKGQRYFAKVLTDGPLSRINFCTIPEREIGEDIPVYGTYDDEFRKSLKPYIENLCMASGLVECQEAYDLAVVLKNENAEFARTSQNRIFENFSFRANVIAYLKACVLYVANGYRWEPEMDDFIRWSERYDLYCKMRFFGDMIARENSAGEKSSKRGPENLLQLLPDIFTMPQLDAIRLEHGLNAKGTRNVIKQWIYRGYIERISPPNEDGKSGYGYSSYSFKKLKYRHDGLVLEA